MMASHSITSAQTSLHLQPRVVARRSCQGRYAQAHRACSAQATRVLCDLTLTPTPRLVSFPRGSFPASGCRTSRLVVLAAGFGKKGPPKGKPLSKRYVPHIHPCPTLLLGNRELTRAQWLSGWGAASGGGLAAPRCATSWGANSMRWRLTASPSTLCSCVLRAQTRCGGSRLNASRGCPARRSTLPRRSLKPSLQNCAG